MPTASPSSSRRAAKIEAARVKIEDAFIARATYHLQKAAAVAMRTSNRRDPAKAWRAALGLDKKTPSVLHKLLLEAQVESYRAGFNHSARPAIKKLSTFSSVSDFLKSDLNITSPEIAFVRVGYSKGVNQIIKSLADEVEAKLTDALVKATGGDLPTSGGTSLLRDAFEKAGVTGPTPYQVETVFRTQTMAAWQVGSIAFEKQPHIDDEIWGYEYVTAGDDRVRPEHAAMDGVRAPKDSPVWDVWTPPCGWSCRCQRVPIFKDQPIAKPTAIPDVDPEAENFPFNPQTLYDESIKRKSA